MYRTRISYHTRMVHTVRVRYVPYAYGTYHTRMVCFLYHTRMVVPYAYTVPHGIKLSMGTGDSIPNAYYAQKAMSFIALVLHY